MESELLLSVCVRTYNQAEYISQGLDSILAQRTSFDFEIVVSDDCSKDGTIEILREYQQKYPQKIRLVLGDVNVGGPANFRRVIESSDAKYLAFLDGDDYYCDVYKLQKQVEFLENNAQYAACFHNVYNEKGHDRVSLFLPLNFKTVHTAEDVISEKWFLPIHSVVLRREFVFFPDWYGQVMNDDYVVNLSVVMHGPYYYMPDVMAVYRHHERNISNQYSDLLLIDSQLKKILEGFRSIYPERYDKVFADKIAFYQHEMEEIEKDEKYPIRKWLRLKTYKRMMRSFLKSKI